MAYQDVIGDFESIRDYIRMFYVDGFWHKKDLPKNKQRSFDDYKKKVSVWINDKQQADEWLDEFMRFERDGRGEGNRYFISIDSRNIPFNPLYRIFKSCSYTSNAITLHFQILDILVDYPNGLIQSELIKHITVTNGVCVDRNTILKILNDYVSLGLITVQKSEGKPKYCLSKDTIDLEGWKQAIMFFSETVPLGVVGSFILDRYAELDPIIQYKHHYILNAIDSEILYELLPAISEKRTIVLLLSGEDRKFHMVTTLPLKIYIGSGNGRDFLLSYSKKEDRFYFTRLESIEQVQLLEDTSVPDDLSTKLEYFQSHTWGTATKFQKELESVTMILKIGPGEKHTIQRLDREKRCGTIKDIGDGLWQFEAQVFDAYELLPWIKTFTGRIIDLKSSNAKLLQTFYDDQRQMEVLYGGK